MRKLIFSEFVLHMLGHNFEIVGWIAILKIIGLISKMARN
jgi:hypothetical protein